MPPSSSGGATMAEMANILESYDVGSMEWHGSEMVHLYAEAFKRAYADRNHYLADPDFIDMPLERMTSAAYAAERAATISDAASTPSADVGPGMEGGPDESENTTHFSIVDADGNAVSVTTTWPRSGGRGLSRRWPTGSGHSSLARCRSLASTTI